METLANLESFVRSAETGSFSSAARRLALTPAAVSRNVAQLERNLGVRLFQRSTRGLTLSEAGERFLQSVQGGLDSIQGAIADLTVFDPATIRGNATVENPNQFSSGIELVVMNGKITFRNGKLAEKPGQPIRA